MVNHRYRLAPGLFQIQRRRAEEEQEVREDVVFIELPVGRRNYMSVDHMDG